MGVDTESYNLGPGYFTGPQEFWGKFFPNHSPQQVYDLLKQGMPGHGSGETIIITDYVDGTFQMDMTFCREQIIQSSFRFMFEGNNACHFADAKVYAPGENGSATQMLANMDRLFDIMHINKVTVAAREIGAYSWLKLGFLPNNMDELAEQIEFKLKRPSIGEEEKEFVKALIKRDPEKPLNPEIAWVIADMATITSGENPVKHGQELLVNTVWKGSRDRTDGKSNTKFEAYTAQKAVVREI